MLVNYIFIWRNDKYKKLIEKYPYNEKSRIYVKYMLLSIGLPVLWIFGMAFKVIP